MSIRPIDRQKMIADYIDAYRAANHKTPPLVRFRDGYFLIGEPAEKYRKAKFRQLTTTLRGRATPPIYRGYRRITK
jgi:hypothetical protein